MAYKRKNRPVTIDIDEDGNAVARGADESQLVGLDDLVASVQSLYDAQVEQTEAATAQAVALVETIKAVNGTNFYRTDGEDATLLTEAQIAKLQLTADGSLVVDGEPEM